MLLNPSSLQFKLLAILSFQSVHASLPKLREKPNNVIKVFM
jgi:hypothetical protein